MQGVKGKGRKLGPVVEGYAASGKEGSASKKVDIYTCRICFEESKDTSQLIAPCMCKGTMTVPPTLGQEWLHGDQCLRETHINFVCILSAFYIRRSCSF